MLCENIHERVLVTCQANSTMENDYRFSLCCHDKFGRKVVTR